MYRLYVLKSSSYIVFKFFIISYNSVKTLYAYISNCYSSLVSQVATEKDERAADEHKNCDQNYLDES